MLISLDLLTGSHNFRGLRLTFDLYSWLKNDPEWWTTSIACLTIDTRIQNLIQVLPGLACNTTFSSIFFCMRIWFIWWIVLSPTILLNLSVKLTKFTKTWYNIEGFSQRDRNSMAQDRNLMTHPTFELTFNIISRLNKTSRFGFV